MDIPKREIAVYTEEAVGFPQDSFPEMCSTALTVHKCSQFRNALVYEYCKREKKRRTLKMDKSLS